MSNPHSKPPVASFDEGTFLLMSNKTGNHKFYHLTLEGDEHQRQQGGVTGGTTHPSYKAAITDQRVTVSFSHSQKGMIAHYGKLGTKGVKRRYPAEHYWKLYDSKRRKGYVDVSDVKRDSLFMCCNEAMLDLGSLGEWDSAKFKNGTHLVGWKCGTTSEPSPLAALVLASLQEE